MFSLNEMHDLAEKAIYVLEEQEKFEEKDMKSIEYILREISEEWMARECSEFRSSFGERLDGDRDEFQHFKNTLSYGNTISEIYRTGEFNHPQLKDYLYGLFFYTDEPKIEQRKAS